MPGLLASATKFETALESDRNKVLERHREKVGETKAGNAAPSALMQLAAQEQKLALDIADLTKQLQAKQQQLVRAYATGRELADARAMPARRRTGTSGFPARRRFESAGR